MAEGKKGSLLASAAVVAIGMIAGLASGWFTISKRATGENYSGWSGNSATGSSNADPWTRARVAVTGLLALTKDQAIYFGRKTDDSGKPFNPGCRYRVTGGPLPGKWWSITVYAADNYLPINDDDALSFDATEVKPDAQGQWSAILAPTKPADGSAWASTRNGGDFDITLRIYQPTAAAQADFKSIPMPKVTLLDCGGKA
ncbi:MAG: DUF1214 domain-containing protein [Novosphingobium sp.]